MEFALFPPDNLSPGCRRLLFFSAGAVVSVMDAFIATGHLAGANLKILELKIQLELLKLNLEDPELEVVP